MSDTRDRATEQELGSLHKDVAVELRRRIREGIATSADLTAAINFLARNDIKAVPTKGSPLETLGETVKGKGISLPFEGDPPNPHTPH